MQVVVIGGGISGLTCAFELQRHGVQTLLLEKSGRVGGVIESVQQEGFLFELGPQSFLSSESLLELIRQLDLEAALLRGDSRAPRYVLLGGRLRAVPMAPPSLLTTSLLGAGSKLRLLSEPFRKTHPPEEDESVAAFVRRKFGTELLDNLVGPFVSGVYAGDPETLSLRSAFPSLYEWEKNYGSVIRGAMKSRSQKDASKDKARPTLCTFRQGVAALPQALHRQLEGVVRTGVEIQALRRGKVNGSTQFDLTLTSEGKTETVSADAMVMAAAAEPAARILSTLSAKSSELLSRIRYSPVIVVSTGYRRDDVGHPLEGFGFLVPRKEGLQLLGTVWSSSLFPGRAPDGMVSLASFVGGATNPSSLEMPDDALLSTVDGELARVLNITAAPVTRAVRKYLHAIPQYPVGHSETRKALADEAARFPGLFFAANYIEGPAIPVCIEQATKTADAVRKYLAESG